MELNILIEGEGASTVFAGTSVPIRSLFEFLQDDQTVDTFLNNFPLIARHQALGILSAALNMLAGAAPKEKLESPIELQASSEDSGAPPNLVCKYCKEPMFPVRGPQGYLHAYSGVLECITPEMGGKSQTRASPYDDKETYPAYRGRLIMDMTRSVDSYCDVDSPPELLEMILADARHFADEHRLNFEDHHRRSCQLYVDNIKGTRRYR